MPTGPLPSRPHSLSNIGHCFFGTFNQWLKASIIPASEPLWGPNGDADCLGRLGSNGGLAGRLMPNAAPQDLGYLSPPWNRCWGKREAEHLGPYLPAADLWASTEPLPREAAPSGIRSFSPRWQEFHKRPLRYRCTARENGS